MNYDEIKNLLMNADIVDDKVVIKTNLAQIIDCAKNDFKFDMLKEIVAIDMQEAGIELLYKLYSSVNQEDLTISYMSNGEAESVSHIFKSAIADENEIYDLFGIRFIGHTNLKRLYMPESWIGHPLKKDYVQTDERLKWNE